MRPTFILFCESPADPGKVDPDFEEELLAAKANDFLYAFFDFDELDHSGNASNATRKIKPAEEETLMVYRGWMLTPLQYTSLYHTLLDKNYRLVNTPEAYQTCHYLPDNLPYIKDHTPQTVFEKLGASQDLESIMSKSKLFGNKPVIVKDYVKSEKHHWDTACFVPNASEEKELEKILRNFLSIRGKYLNEGIVIRAFEQLQHLTTHTKSGMPLALEYRLFFAENKLISINDYWEEGQYTPAKPDTSVFEKIARQIPSRFFTMDIAQKTNGEWIIVELGDGQVAGIPDRSDKKKFYAQLKKAIR